MDAFKISYLYTQLSACKYSWITEALSRKVLNTFSFLAIWLIKIQINFNVNLNARMKKHMHYKDVRLFDRRVIWFVCMRRVYTILGCIMIWRLSLASVSIRGIQSSNIMHITVATLHQTRWAFDYTRSNAISVHPHVRDIITRVYIIRDVYRCVIMTELARVSFNSI